MPPIDPSKIQSKIDELNARENIKENKQWFSADGYHALTVFLADPQPSFNPNNGIPLKVFVNKTTGEVQIYDARSFKR